MKGVKLLIFGVLLVFSGIIDFIGVRDATCISHGKIRMAIAVV